MNESQKNVNNQLKTALGNIEYLKTNSDVKKFINVTIGRYYKAHFVFIEDALKFVDLAISGGADPAEIKLYITFKEGEEENETES